jgi:hypothetical protein
MSSLEVEVKSRPTVSRPVCLGVERPFGTYDQIFLFCLTIVGFLMLGIFSGERMGLEFTCTITSEPCQSTHSRVHDPQNSRPYFTVSFEIPSTWRARPPYLYLPGTRWPSYTPGHWIPFSSPLTNRRAMVEVF